MIFYTGYIIATYKMYKQVFNPNHIEKFSTKELNIIYNCIDCNIRLHYAFKVLQKKYSKLWFRLNKDDLEKSYKFYCISKKLEVNRINFQINKIIPAYTPEVMKMGEKLCDMLVEKSIPLNLVYKVVKNYIKICIKINKEESRMLKHFTPEKYLEKILDGTLVKIIDR